MTRAEPVAASGASWRTNRPLDLSPILSSALDAFYDNGYHGAGMRDIARRVGFTVPALYYHHENKEAMLYAILDRSIERVAALCLDALAEAGDDPVLRYCNLIECLVLYMTHSSKTAYLDHEIRALSPEHRRDHSAKRKRVESLLAATISDGVAAGVFRVASADESARAIAGMVQSVATWFHPAGPQSPEQIAVAYVDVAAQTVGITTKAHTVVRRHLRQIS